MLMSAWIYHHLSIIGGQEFDQGHAETEPRANVFISTKGHLNTDPYGEHLDLLLPRDVTTPSLRHTHVV